MSKALEKSAKLLSKRLVIAQKIATDICDEFEQRYESFVFGQPWLRTQEDAKRYYDKLGESDDALRIKRGQDTTTFPLHGMFRNVMLPYMMANDPTFLNVQRLGADEIERAFVELYNRVATQVWSESDTTFEFQRALDDAFCYRMGWMRTEYDTRMGLPAHRWIDSRNMLVDCQSPGPRIRDRRWIAEKLILPIETAEWFAKEIWDNPSYEFTPIHFEDEKSEEKLARGAGRSREMPENADNAGEFVRVVLVQVKGENPYTMSAKYGKKTMDDPAGQDDVYDGQDHVMILEACNDYDSEDGYKAIGRTDWAFPCKGGDFIYTPVTLTRDNRSVYPYSIMQPGHSTQVSADLNIQAYNTDMRSSARRWGAYQEEAFQDPADARKVIESDDALVMLALKPGMTPDRAVAMGNFGQPNPALKEGHAISRENYEAIQGMNKFDVQVRANQTALNTSVQNEAAQVKIDALSQLVTRAVVSLAEKSVMCARANMAYADLIHWINAPKKIGEVVVETVATTKEGKPVLESKLWPNNPDWDDVRREVEVNIEPRSVRFSNPEKEAQDITEIMNKQTEIFRVIGDTVGKGGVAAAQEIARTWNEWLKMVCTLKNVKNWERLQIAWEKITAPEPPPVDPNKMAQAQVDDRGNMMQAINQQQQAAATRLQNQGVDTSMLPPDVGGGGM